MKTRLRREDLVRDPFSERTRADRLRRWKRIALAVLVVAAAIALVWLVWFSSVLSVKDVEVSGRTTLKQSQVLRAAQVPTGRPLARVDIDAIEGRVSQLNRVDTVEVSRSWPHTLSISIVERRSVVWSTINGEVRGIDRNGIAFRAYDKAPDNLLEATIDVTDTRDRLRISQAVAEVVVLIADRDPALRKQVVSVGAKSLDSIELELDDDRTVVWGSSDDGDRKLQVLDPLLRLEASRYDVSAPDQPTTTP